MSKKKSRGKTIAEVRYRSIPSFAELSKTWNAAAVEKMLGFVWNGFDALKADVLDKIDLSEAEEDLERNITQLLDPQIRAVMTGEEPYYIQHAYHEEETRLSAPAQPPLYDLAFVLSANPRIAWPLEAKLLHSDTSVASYVREVKKNYLSCRYAPFVREAAMLGYLLQGEPQTAFRSIAKKIKVKLKKQQAFKGRDHRYSTHKRRPPKGKPYPRKFRCHHMLFEIGNS